MKLARFAGRGYPFPIAGRSLMPSWHPHTPTGLRFTILLRWAAQAGSWGMGNPFLSAGAAVSFG
ncbi:MAG: hypothetical protein ACK5SI_02900, partial [Planctomycetia bacterium]